MTKTIISNKAIRITGANGILDTRTGKVYSEFVGSPEKENIFIDAPEEEEQE